MTPPAVHDIQAAAVDRMILRVRFSKKGKVRFLSHRDLARLMERTFRKLRLPVAYSGGFSPRPKFSFGLALSVGHESDAEYLDVELATSVDIEDLPARLTEVLPAGLAVSAVGELRSGEKSLQQAIACCSWDIEILGAPPDDVAAATQAILAAPALLFERERKGKTSVADVRPALLEAVVAGPTGSGTQLRAVLATDLVSLRPSELIRVLDAELPERNLIEGRVCRTHQWTMVDHCRVEPLAVVESAPHAELRAS
jgi:radical SAM-linked protein